MALCLQSLRNPGRCTAAQRSNFAQLPSPSLFEADCFVTSAIISARNRSQTNSHQPASETRKRGTQRNQQATPTCSYLKHTTTPDRPLFLSRFHHTFFVSFTLLALPSVILYSTARQPITATKNTLTATVMRLDGNHDAAAQIARWAHVLDRRQDTG